MIGIDAAHAQLVTGLVMSFKPYNILELGYGDGVSCAAIMAGSMHNQNKPHYTLVDSWLDWGGKRPESTFEAARTHGKGPTLESFTVVTSNEKDFVESTHHTPQKFDFIMSDADHQQTDQWALYVYDEMLTSPGILIYHDTAEGYAGLKTIKPNLFTHYPDAKVVEFTRSTREDENCGRGLLVIFKP